MMADSDTQEARQPAKDSPFSIKNLLNIEDKPTKPKSILSSHKGVLEGSFFSRLGDLSVPRFELPAQRIGLSAQYLERASTWWYPYTLGAHFRTGGKLLFCFRRGTYSVLILIHVLLSEKAVVDSTS